MRIDQAFPSNYLKAVELNGQCYVLTMGRVDIETIGDDQRPVLHFQNAGKGLVLNKTNAGTLEVLYGPETDTWFGQKIELYPDVTIYQGRRVDCIRVRRPQGQMPQAPAPMPAGAQALAATLPPTQNPGPVEQGLAKEVGHGPAPAPADTGQYSDDDIPF